MSLPRPSGDPVAALAAEVADLARQVQSLGERTNDHDERVQGLSGQLSRLGDRLEHLVDREEADNPAIWWWPTTTAPAAEERWPEFIEWVSEAIYDRHPVHARTLRPCWLLHTDVVDQLTAIYVAWQWAYESSGSLPTAAAEWQLRYLPDAMNRIKASLQSCTKNHQGPAVPQRPTPADIDRFITADLEQRRSTP